MTVPERGAEMHCGDASAVTAAVDEIVAADGSVLRPLRAGVTVVVGANNVGKSTFLRELQEVLAASPYHAHAPRLLVRSATLENSGSLDDLDSWIRSRGQVTLRHNQYQCSGPQRNTVALEEAKSHWNDIRSTNSFQSLATWFMYSGDVNSRFGWLGPTQAPDGEMVGHHAIHELRNNSDLMTQVNDLCKRVFRKTLTLDWVSSGQWRLRVGRPSVEPPLVTNIPPEYIQALESLPPLEEQGDGMKSLLGIVIPLIVGLYPIVLLDEPEAFLHPPQARALGRILGAVSRANGTQVIVATHDRNLLVGLLEAEASVSVIRIGRSETGHASAHQLDAATVDSLWSDPMLRYSNALDALFHRAVVLCEADGDCRFYAASLDHYESINGSTLHFPASDILFAPVNGKDGFKKVAHAFREVMVPTVAVGDIDLLRESSKLRPLIERLGGEWDRYKAEFVTVARAVNGDPGGRTSLEVLEEITSALSGQGQEIFGTESQERIREITAIAKDSWALFKRVGVSMLDGEALSAYEALRDALSEVGVVLVDNGELERLAPHVRAAKGPNWLAEALQTRSYEQETAQAHIAKVVRALSMQLK